MRFRTYLHTAQKEQAEWRFTPAVLLPPLDVTPAAIRWFKDKYFFSWSSFAAALGYSSKASVAEIANGTAPITAKFRQRFLLAYTRSVKERGHYVELVVCDKAKAENPVPWQRLPKILRVAVQPVKCLGHREWCLLDPRLPKDQWFCGEDCKRLYQKRSRRKTGKRGIMGSRR